MTQQLDQLRIRKQRDAGRILHRVEIRNQWDRDPVTAVNAVIAADDHASFAKSATAQAGRSLGAYAREIYGGMPGSRKGPVIAVGLFQQKGSLCLNLVRHGADQGYNTENKRLDML